jgi:hypothetical protein
MGKRIMIADRDLDVLAELTDERLDMLADRYRELCVHNLTGATFEGYVRDPGYFDAVVEWLRAGCGVRFEAAASGRRRAVQVALPMRRGEGRLRRLASALGIGRQAARPYATAARRRGRFGP